MHSSMIILIVNQLYVSGGEKPERQAPVSIHGNSIEPNPITLKNMQPPAWHRHIAGAMRRIELSQLQS